ncbi:efflux RND transporter periplasmic adaptor subunit [Citrobacter amalonaticus]
MKKYRIRPVAVTLVVSLALVACKQEDAGNTATADKKLDVGVVTIQSQPLALLTELPGRTTAVNRAEVRPQVSGVILKRLFKEGSDVKAGQQLYQIDPASFQATRDKAAATLFSAHAQAQRDKPLAAANAISQQQYVSDIASEREAAADLKTADINLNYTQVRAPLSGTIGRSSVTEGALVTDGQSTALATITQLDPIYVDVTQSYGDILRMRREFDSGQLTRVGDNAVKVSLTLDDGSTYSLAGRLEFSEVSVDEGTGSVTLRATFPNPKHLLLPGMFVHAKLNEGTNQNAILVPQKAISRDSQGNATVFVVDGNDQAKQISITTSQMYGGNYLVTNGLSNGDKVIINNLQSVKDGQKVNPTEAQPSSSKKKQSSGNMSFIESAER